MAEAFYDAKVIPNPIPRRASSVYQLKIILRGFKPKIWRRIQVPSNSTFYDLHCVIQRVMNWDDRHLHCFKKGKLFEFRNVYIGKRKNCRIFPDTVFIDEEEAKVCDYFTTICSQICYVYDLDFIWEHDIILEKIKVGDPKIEYPICIAGRNAGPPENCGGQGLSPKTWLYDPTKFDPEKAMQRHWRSKMSSKDFKVEKFQ